MAIKPNLDTKGFNLIGYATSPTGLGEDLRSFAAMLDHLGIAFSIIDIPTDSSGKVPVRFSTMTTQDYATSMFFMSAMECQILARENPKLFSEPKTKIGYFLWELPDFPDEYRSALKLVDHIWCPSKFVQKAFFDKSQQLILSLPLPVIQSKSSKKENGKSIRAKLGIPTGAFVCLFMFDVRSSLNRKNPQGAVAAFIEFAKDKEDAYLVLKINRWQKSDPDLLSWLPKSSKIKIITETLLPEELGELYQASNCYLSLHRSEGFGRTLVESLQHGLWLVSTNYSGPGDYLNQDNCKLVSHQSHGVMPGDYPLATYSTWADPNIEEATECLEKLYVQEFKAGLRNEAGIATGMQFTLAGLANKYKAVLLSYLQ